MLYADLIEKSHTIDAIDNQQIAYYDFQNDLLSKPLKELDTFELTGRRIKTLSAEYIYLMNYFAGIGGFD